MRLIECFPIQEIDGPVGMIWGIRTILHPQQSTEALFAGDITITTPLSSVEGKKWEVTAPTRSVEEVELELWDRIESQAIKFSEFEDGRYETAKNSGSGALAQQILDHIIDVKIAMKTRRGLGRRLTGPVYGYVGMFRKPINDHPPFTMDSPVLLYRRKGESTIDYVLNDTPNIRWFDYFVWNDLERLDDD